MLRVVAAIVGIPLLLFSFYRGNLFLLIVVIGLIILALGEYNRLIKRIGHANLLFPLLISGIIIPLLSQGENWIYIGYVMYLLALVAFLNFVISFPGYTIPDLALTMLGIVYIAAGFSHMLLVRSLENGFWLITFVFLIIWSTDTGAYFAGILIGKNKLAPKLSPNKTWEGVIGGLATSILVIFLFLRYIELPQGSLLLYITPLISIAAQLGDLFESGLKRFSGAKDSGKIGRAHV